MNNVVKYIRDFDMPGIKKRFEERMAIHVFGPIIPIPDTITIRIC